MSWDYIKPDSAENALCWVTLSWFGENFESLFPRDPETSASDWNHTPIMAPVQYSLQIGKSQSKPFLRRVPCRNLLLLEVLLLAVFSYVNLWKSCGFFCFLLFSGLNTISKVKIQISRDGSFLHFFFPIPPSFERSKARKESTLAPTVQCSNCADFYVQGGGAQEFKLTITKTCL